MSGQVRFRSASKVLARSGFRPCVQILEDRLPPGDLLAGLIFGPAGLVPYLSGLDYEASAADAAVTAGPSANSEPEYWAHWVEQEPAPRPAATVSLLVPLAIQGGESQRDHAESWPASVPFAADAGNSAVFLPLGNAFLATGVSGLPAPAGVPSDAAGASSSSAGAASRLPGSSSVESTTTISAGTSAFAQGGAIPSLGRLLAAGDTHQLSVDSAAALVRPVYSPASLSFDSATGQLTIQADMRDHGVAEIVAPNGFVEVTLGTRRHNSDPASGFFDPSLAGASATSLRMVREEGGGGHSTLTLGGQALSGAFTVEAEGPVTVTGDVAAGGSLAITAPAITVSGTLRAPTVGLTVAGTVRVDPGAAIQADGGRVHLAGNTIDNSGQIRADGSAGGQVSVSAATVRNTGRIDADGLVGDGGTVWIGYMKSYTDTPQAEVSANGGPGGRGGNVTIVGASSSWLAGRAIPEAVAAPGSDVVAAGALQATGLQGGTITVTGDTVSLARTATADVSGASGGGSVRIGGDFHGQGSTPTASQTYLARGTTIKADAVSQGSGGAVAVWSNDQTWYYGTISARGGSSSGDGGALEVSGKQNLIFAGLADTSAVHGANGTLLLDPYDINVVENGETSDLNDVNDFSIPNRHGDPDPHNPGGTDISVAAINNFLGSYVSLAAYHDININTAINMTNFGSGLRLYAGHDININNPITVRGASIFLQADFFQVGNGGAIRQAQGGDLTINNPQGGSTIYFSADRYDLHGRLNASSFGTITFRRVLDESIYLASSITDDGTNTIYVSQDVLTNLTARDLNVGGDGHAGPITVLSNLDVSASGMGLYFTVDLGIITTFDGAVYHSLSVGTGEIDFNATGDITTGNITGSPADGVTLNSLNGVIGINGDVVLPDTILTLYGLRYYATGVINLGSYPYSLFFFVPSASGMLVTVGGPGGTGSLEFTDAELANITAEAVGIGDGSRPLAMVLGNNIDLTGRWDLFLYLGGGSFDPMGYTVTEGDHSFLVI